MESTNYTIQSDSINIGGMDEASSTNYAIVDTFGESGTGKLTGVLYHLLAGYRQAINAIIGVTCDNDGVCETGETETNCPNDCGCNNNGTCESARGETVTNCPNDCVTTVLTGGGAGNIDISAPNIYNLSIFSATYSVVIKWQTSEKTISNLFWGETPKHEKGTIPKANYATQHLILIENLIPGISYYFQIEVKDVSGNKTLSQDQIFKTMALPDEIPPSNVSNMKIEEEDTQLKISWQNPPDPDFKEVRIVKNNQFYPQDPHDGEIVYQGKEEHFIDEDVLDEDYYYAIFSYDEKGNYSSGAIIKSKPKKAPPAPPKPPIEPPIIPPVVPSEIEELKLEDISFIQDGKELSMRNDSILADAGKSLKISIDYEKLPEVLKTIIINIEKCDSSSVIFERAPATEGSQSCQNPKTFSFLLKVSNDKTEYSATILSPYEAGIYPLVISILDFQHQELKQLSGKLLLRQKLLPTEDQESNLIWIIIGKMIVLTGGLGLLFLVGYAGWRINAKLKRNLTFPSS